MMRRSILLLSFLVPLLVALDAQVADDHGDDRHGDQTGHKARAQMALGDQGAIK